MSQLLRSELKEIVKECLVEILAEGIGASKNRQPREKRKAMPSKKISQKRQRYLDSMEYGDIPLVNESQKANKKIDTAITSDPMLNEMLADTAQTTLKEQVAADRKGGLASVANMDKASMVASQNKPEDLFGKEASSKWAQLAFFDQ